MESFQVMTILVQQNVLVASFSEEVRDDDKRKVILKLCQHVIMFNPKTVHVVFEHNPLPETLSWLLEYGFSKGYTDKDYHTIKIDPDFLVKSYTKGFLTNKCLNFDSPTIWKAKL